MKVLTPTLTVRGSLRVFRFAGSCMLVVIGRNLTVVPYSHISPPFAHLLHVGWTSSPADQSVPSTCGISRHLEWPWAVRTLLPLPPTAQTPRARSYSLICFIIRHGCRQPRVVGEAASLSRSYM